MKQLDTLPLWGAADRADTTPARSDEEPRLNRQQRAVLNLLRSRRRVSNLELNDVCFRYSARIHELRNAGYEITCTNAPRGVRWYEIK